MDDGRNPRPLIDDTEFLADLEALDNGLTDGRRLVPPPAQPQAAPSVGDSPVPQPPGSRRPLTELFPPASSDTPATEARSGPDRGPVREPRRDEAFYGFVEPPFSLDPDPRFYFHTADQDRIAQQIVDGIARDDAWLVVTGSHGIGKTTLCSAIVQQLDRRALVSFVAKPPATFDALVQTLLVDFGVASRETLEPNDGNVETLRTFLSSLSSQSRAAVIVIDEAEKATPEVLRAVHALADAAPNRLQIILAGSPSLTRLLRDPALAAVDKRVALRTELGALAPDEIAGYVMHRVSIAGAGSRIEFTADAIARLYDVSLGVPRVVNQVCDRAIARAFESSATAIDRRLMLAAAADVGIAAPASGRDWIAYVALGIGFAAGAAAAGWVFRDRVQAILSRWPLFR